MLTAAENYIKRYNPAAIVKCYGQEIMPQTYAVDLAEMLIRNQDSSNYRQANTLMQDCWPNTRVRFVFMNPPLLAPSGATREPPTQTRRRTFLARMSSTASDIAGLLDSRRRMTRSCSFSRRRSTSSQMMAEPSSSRMGPRSSTGTLVRVSLKFVAGFWRRTCSKRSSLSHRPRSSTLASQSICGFSRRASAQSARAKCSSSECATAAKGRRRSRLA